MKKLFLIIVAVLTLLALCACGADKPAPSPEENPAPETSSSQPEQEETPAEPDEEEEKVDPKRGEVTGFVYENKAFGVKFTASETWYFLSDDEIAATMGIAADQMFTEEYAELVENARIIYDMYASDTVTGSTVNVNYENLGLLYGTVFNEEYYLEICKTQLAEQITAESGITVDKCEISTASTATGSVPCLDVVLSYSTEMGSVSVYEKILVRKTGTWMCAFTVAASDPEALDSVTFAIEFN